MKITLCFLFGLDLVYLLFNVTFNDIAGIFVTEHRCAGGLKKRMDFLSGSHAIDIS